MLSSPPESSTSHEQEGYRSSDPRYAGRDGGDGLRPRGGYPGCGPAFFYARGLLALLDNPVSGCAADALGCFRVADAGQLVVRTSGELLEPATPVPGEKTGQGGEVGQGQRVRARGYRGMRTQRASAAVENNEGVGGKGTLLVVLLVLVQATTLSRRRRQVKKGAKL